MKVNIKNHDEFLSVPIVSEILRVSKAKAYDLVSSGALPFFDFSGVKRVSRKDLESFIQKSKRA